MECCDTASARPTGSRIWAAVGVPLVGKGHRGVPSTCQVVAVWVTERATSCPVSSARSVVISGHNCRPVGSFRGRREIAYFVHERLLHVGSCRCRHDDLLHSRSQPQQSSLAGGRAT